MKYLNYSKGLNDMNESHSQVTRLSDSIIEYAEQTASQLIIEAEAKRNQILNDATNIDVKPIDVFESEARRNCQKRVSYYEFESYKKLLSHRSKIVDDLFEEVIGKIKAFTQSNEYLSKLLQLIDRAKSEKAFNESTVVLLSENDIKYAENIKNTYSLSVKIDKAIVYGGAIISYPDAGIIIDNTFDSALEAERKKFVNHKELSL